MDKLVHQRLGPPDHPAEHQGGQGDQRCHQEGTNPSKDQGSLYLLHLIIVDSQKCKKPENLQQAGDACDLNRWPRIGGHQGSPRYNTPRQKARLGCELMLLVLSMVYLAKVAHMNLDPPGCPRMAQPGGPAVPGDDGRLPLQGPLPCRQHSGPRHSTSQVHELALVFIHDHFPFPLLVMIIDLALVLGFELFVFRLACHRDADNNLAIIIILLTTLYSLFFCR